MKKILLILFNIVMLTGTYAQLTLTLNVPQSGVLLKPQLWNGVLTNSYPQTKRFYLGLTLSDVTTGQPVLSAVSSAVDIATGALQITETTVSPIKYDYLNSNISDRNPEGFLPVGTYTACYTVFLIDENSGTPVTEQCIPISIEPVSPPLLSIPFESQVIHNPYPQFSWIPPTPLEIFSDLNYDFVLVQVQEGQSAPDAIQQNLPLYTENTRDIFLNYPSSYPGLDTGKTYAWTITAKNSDQYAAQSDVWTFSLSDTSLRTTAQDLSQYTKLKRTLDASMAVSTDNLQAYYENDAGDSTVSYSLYNIDQNGDGNSGLELIATDSLVLKPGINFISIPINKINGMGYNKQYLFQISNSRNELWSMKFIYYKNN